MSGDSDKDLMEAILRQIDGKIDYQVLANDLGLGKAKSAWQRWSRFKKAKLSGGAKKSPTAAKVMKASAATPPKTPKGAGNKGKGFKKRKLESADEDEVDLEIKEDEGADGGGNWDEAMQQTPSRRLPARKARVISFKEDQSEAENDEEGEDFADSGHGSGHGGMDDDDEFFGASDEGEI
jgi:hypothetical protein